MHWNLFKSLTSKLLWICREYIEDLFMLLDPELPTWTPQHRHDLLETQTLVLSRRIKNFCYEVESLCIVLRKVQEKFELAESPLIAEYHISGPAPGQKAFARLHVALRNVNSSPEKALIEVRDGESNLHSSSAAPLFVLQAAYMPCQSMKQVESRTPLRLLSEFRPCTRRGFRHIRGVSSPGAPSGGVKSRAVNQFLSETIINVVWLDENPSYIDHTALRELAYETGQLVPSAESTFMGLGRVLMYNDNHHQLYFHTQPQWCHNGTLEDRLGEQELEVLGNDECFRLAQIISLKYLYARQLHTCPRPCDFHYYMSKPDASDTMMKPYLAIDFGSRLPLENANPVVELGLVLFQVVSNIKLDYSKGISWLRMWATEKIEYSEKRNSQWENHALIVTQAGLYPGP